ALDEVLLSPVERPVVACQRTSGATGAFAGCPTAPLVSPRTRAARSTARGIRIEGIGHADTTAGSRPPAADWRRSCRPARAWRRNIVRVFDSNHLWPLHLDLLRLLESGT